MCLRGKFVFRKGWGSTMTTFLLQYKIDEPNVPIHLCLFPAQSADCGEMGKLIFESLSDGDRACADITVLNDTLLEGPETLTVTIMPNTIIINVMDTAQVTIEDEGKKIEQVVQLWFSAAVVIVSISP